MAHAAGPRFDYELIAKALGCAPDAVKRRLWPPTQGASTRVFKLDGAYYCCPARGGPPSRDLASLTLSFSTGVSRSIGAKRSFDHTSAIASVGWITSRGAGSWWMWKPMQLLIVSAHPTCAAFMQTTVSMDSSLTASTTPRRYSARRVDHFPGAALASGLR